MALFRPIRRIISPREDRNRGGSNEETPPDTPVSATSTGGRPSAGDLDSVVVDNAIYSEPTPLDRAEHRHSHQHRISGDDPPLPPRPMSGGVISNQSEKETYYQAPVDTLGRSAEQQLLLQQQQQRLSTRDRERAAQERERRQMDMHERTLNQIQGASGANPGHQHHHHHHQNPHHMMGGGGLGHRRTRSGGHLIDNEEYSTPWDVQGEQRRRGSGLAKTSHSSRRPPIQGTPSDGSDNIIPLSPTPILSTSHERSQSASPVPPRSPVQPPAADAEYDDPWDVRNRNISQVIPSQHGRHHTHSAHERRSPPLAHTVAGSTGEHRAGVRHTAGGRIDQGRQHLEEVRPSRALSDRNNHRSGSGVEILDPFRSHSMSHSSSPNAPRSGSMSASAMQRRPLPDEPIMANPASLVLPPPSGLNSTTRAEQPAVLFDSNLALEEQL